MRMALSVLAIFAMTGLADAAVTVKKSDFGKMPDGSPVALYTVTNSKGMEAKIITYGGILVSLKTPDRKGVLGDVTLGHDNLADYRADKSTYFGAIIGRYANRIGNAEFKLNGQSYKLPKNNGANTLHGGPNGFDKQNWKAREVAGGVELTYFSKEGEEGFPGNLTAIATYTLTEDNRLRVRYSATTDKDTVVNLTHHAYWNLKGSGSILDHLVTLNAEFYTPVDAGLIPTGQIKGVPDTPFDFRKPMNVGSRIGANDPQLKLGRGYDHNWALFKGAVAMSLAARVEESTTGRVIEVYTDQPGIQFYTGNFLDGKVKGKGQKPMNLHEALCLETQHFPDAPNKPRFASSVLKPGQKYETTTEFRFSAK